MKTKIIALLLLIAMVLSLCACDLGNIISSVGGEKEAVPSFDDAVSLVKGIIGDEPVKSDIALPTTYKNFTISYESSDPAVLSAEGKITRGLEDTKVYLTVRVSDGTDTKETIVAVTVAKTERTVSDLLALLNNTYDSIVAGIPSGKITGNLSLPSSLNGFSLTYASTDASVLDKNGSVHRGETDQDVTLTVTFTYGDFSSSKDIPLCVEKKESDDPTVEDLRIALGLLKNRNMQFTMISLTDCKEDDSEDDATSYIYTMADGITRWASLSAYPYYYVDNGETRAIYYNNGSGYQLTDDTDPMFELALLFTGYLGFNFDMDSANYEYRDGWFYAKNACVYEEVCGFFGESLGEGLASVKSVKIRLEGKFIAEIDMEAEYTEEDGGNVLNYTSSMNFIFSGFGKQSLTLPELLEGPTVEEIQNAFSALDNMQLLSSITYDYREDDEDDGVDVTLFTFADGIIAWEGTDGYSYYLYEDDDAMAIITVDPDGEATLFTENDEYFSYLLYYSDYYDYQFDLDAYAYEYSDGWLVPKDGYLTSEAQKVIGTYENDEITNLALHYEDGYITEIVITTVYTQEYKGQTYVCDYTYELTLGGFGQQNITLPEVGGGQGGDDNEDLANAIAELANGNYSVDSTVTYDYREDDDYDGTDAAIFLYDDGVVCWEDSYGYTNYLYENESGILCLVTGTEKDGFELFTENDSDFEDLLYESCYYDYLFDLTAANYEYSDGWYVPKAAYLASEAQKVIGTYDGEEILSMKIRLDEGSIAEIRITTLYVEEYDSETYNCDYTYVLLIGGIGEQDLEIPDVSGGNTEDSIADLYTADENDTLTLSGWVAGCVKTYMLVTDGENTCVFYFANKSNYTSLKRGDFITATGTATQYKGLYELKVSGDATVDASKFAIPENEVLTGFDSLDDVTKQGKVYDFENLTVTKAYASSTSDIVMQVSDGTTTLDLLIKTTLKELGSSLFSSLKVGDTFSIRNLGIGWYNGVQLMLTSEAELIKDGITVTPSKKTVDIGTSLADVKASLTVSVRSEGSTQTVDISDCTVTGTYNENTAGTYTLTVAYGGYSATVSVTVKQKTAAFKPEDAEILLDVLNADNSIIAGIPSTGDVEVLVLPIAFNNKTVPSNYKTVLEAGFNGTSEDTGWESLNSYYAKASYGALNLTANILDVYQTGENYNAKETYDDCKDIEWLHEALAAYDSQIDYTEYDQNDDGYIDCLYVIYFGDINYEDEESIWWAYTNFDEEPATYDGLSTGCYMFFGYDFFLNELCDENDNPITSVTVNAETVIHETGHALGLDDYYDYDDTKGSNKLMGGGLMMDYNVGDHDAYSKTLLGWIVPTVVIDSDYTVTLGSFGETGDAVIIAKNWNNSFYAEYYIIDFYTPDGLNTIQAGVHGLFTVSGVRIIHVSAEKGTSPDSCWTITKYDNSYTSIPLLSLIEADNKGCISKNGYSTDGDLFTAGKTYSPKWNDGTSAGCTIKIDSINANGATITIDFD